MKKINGNKYLDRFNEVTKTCCKELINIFRQNNIKEMTFKEGQKGMDYPVRIRIIDDDFGNVYEIELTKIEYKGATNPYLSVLGVDCNNKTFGCYIDELGGDGYDIEHSLGNIYKAVIDQIEFNKKNRYMEKPIEILFANDMECGKRQVLLLYDTTSKPKDLFKDAIRNFDSYWREENVDNELEELVDNICKYGSAIFGTDEFFIETMSLYTESKALGDADQS